MIHASMQISVAFKAMDCPTCGVYFAVTEELVARRQKDLRPIHCPNGHTMGYQAAADVYLDAAGLKQAREDAEDREAEFGRLKEANAALLARLRELEYREAGAAAREEDTAAEAVKRLLTPSQPPAMSAPVADVIDAGVSFYQCGHCGKHYTKTNSASRAWIAKHLREVHNIESPRWPAEAGAAQGGSNVGR